MNKSYKPALTQAINRRAHELAAQSFSSIRASLEQKVRALLRDGKSPEETMLAILAAEVHAPTRDFWCHRPCAYARAMSVQTMAGRAVRLWVGAPFSLQITCPPNHSEIMKS